jgi:hypothetical protein
MCSQNPPCFEMLQFGACVGGAMGLAMSAFMVPTFIVFTLGNIADARFTQWKDLTKAKNDLELACLKKQIRDVEQLSKLD